MIQDIPINLIENNNGQLPGLPANPRLTNETKLVKLMDSIRQDPEMLQLRGLLVYKVGDIYITIGGNMRLQALKRLGYTTVTCCVIPPNTPVEKLKNYIVKDNGSFGDWDYQALTQSWDIEDLDSWAIDVPPFDIPDNDDDKKRMGWNMAKDYKESVCDMKDVITWHPKDDFSYISCFKKSEQGFPLSQIKSDFQNVHGFANAALNVIQRVAGLHDKNNWAILTTPKRRHKEQNFAESVCIQLAKRLGIPFHADAVDAKTRQRVNPTFTLNYDIKESNLIIYDDIITTGSTLVAMNKLFPTKNCIYVVGINNN